MYIILSESCPRDLSLSASNFDADRTLPFKKHSPDTPLQVGGILKLTTKYGMLDLWERTISQLEEDWPTNLFCWDLLENEIDVCGATLRDHSYQDDEDDFGIVDRRYPEPASAIRLAKDCEVLP